uniref:Zinc finger protein 512 n=1 Tax=Takifugu rubripes TaxID=31033 RepID=A0A674NHA6_TAKRU
MCGLRVLRQAKSSTCLRVRTVTSGRTGGTPRPQVCMEPGVCEGSTLHRSDEQKPPVSSIKKDPPTYPAGSEEERWQIQIVAKGRVSCPKCKSVSRKTVEGLKKHMENCRQQPFTCQHCGKQLKSSTGMKYHIMADHSHLPLSNDAKDLDDRVIKEKLRKILKRLGKLKCSKEGCNAAFSSIMGYVYHMRKCGKQESELEKLLLNCSHCGKPYKSKAGLEYHLRSEHAPVSHSTQRHLCSQRTARGRVQRASAQVANFHLAEIANNELPKDWPKRKFQSDLVPDDKKLKYARPGLPAFSQDVLRKWKNEVKLRRKVKCPNQGCCSTYTSVSGLKAHLGLCTKGEFEAGKYRCLICNKEFNSESGVKYHINSIHSEVSDVLKVSFTFTSALTTLNLHVTFSSITFTLKLLPGSPSRASSMSVLIRDLTGHVGMCISTCVLILLLPRNHTEKIYKVDH